MYFKSINCIHIYLCKNTVVVKYDQARVTDWDIAGSFTVCPVNILILVCALLEEYRNFEINSNYTYVGLN